MTKPLSYLADRLKIESVLWSIQRNDELSGTGDGRVWQAELAPPLWTAEIIMHAMYPDDAEECAALIRALNGASEPFLLFNPVKRYPRKDKNGHILGDAVITVSSISTDRKSLSLNGLPAGYALCVGDKIQIPYGNDRHMFVEVSVDTIASEDGSTTQFQIFPMLRIGIETGATVIIKHPACKMIVYPNTHNPGSSSGGITMGATFKAVEKR